MNLRSSHKQSLLAWLLPLIICCATLAVFIWSVWTDSFDAEQSRLHPFLAGRNILSQLTMAAPPWEWHIPLWSILVWALWLISVWGMGWFILRSKFLNKSVSAQPASVQAVLAFATGYTLFGILVLITGLFGLARFPIFPLVLIVTGIAGWQSSGFRDDLFRFPRAIRWQWGHGSLSTHLVMIALGSAVVFMLPPALTPPVQSDAVRYHLGAPQEFLKQGIITYLPSNAYSNMPFFTEMHYLQALASHAPEATQLMHMTLALFTALGIYALIIRLNVIPPAPGQDSRRMPLRTALALLPPLLYLTTPMAAVLGTWPFTDHAMAFLLVSSALAALLCIAPAPVETELYASESTPARSRWILLGVCLGGLLGTKYTMAPVALLLLILTTIIQQTNRQTWKNAVWAAGYAGVTGCIWYLKNWYFTGNPFYPLASQWFPGGDWGTANDRFLHSRAGLKGSGTGITDLLDLPLQSTFHWTAFESHNPGVTTLVMSGIALLAIVHYWRHANFRSAMIILTTALATFIAWFYSYQSNRLLLPIMALTLGLTPISLLMERKLARRLFYLGIGMAAIMGLAWAVQWSWVATSLTPRPLPYLLGGQDSKTYRYKSLTYARAFDYLNKHVDPQEKVLLVGEHRIYGAEFHALWSDWFDTPMLARILRENRLMTMASLLDYLRSKSINWVLINEKELEPQLQDAFRPWFSSQEWQIFEDLRQLNQPDVTVLRLPPGVTLLHLEPRS